MNSTVDVRRAPHAESPESGYDALIEACAAVFERGGIDYLAHFGNGLFNVSLSRDLAASPDALSMYELSCRQLVILTERYDRLLQGLHMGDLMHLVVASPDRALVCCRIRPGQYLVGVSAADDQLDRRVCDAAVAVRAIYHLPDEMMGGRRDLPLDDDPTPGIRLHRGGDPPEAFLRLVNGQDLHYAGCFRQGGRPCAVDAFPELGTWFSDIARETRREIIEQFGRTLRQELAHLCHALRLVMEGPVERLVLDVQEGALYVLAPAGADGGLLVGLTLDQYEVDRAERRLRRVLDSC
ncbi:hypothetical protein [Nonomuraea sp. NPDC050783]|uniref:hypothetical protein n=1 Tax=Nonomuraea sp. NPDC050783 TaxID=3154634 RepID=UPI003467DA80